MPSLVASSVVRFFGGHRTAVASILFNDIPDMLSFFQLGYIFLSSSRTYLD